MLYDVVVLAININLSHETVVISIPHPTFSTPAAVIGFVKQTMETAIDT